MWRWWSEKICVGWKIRKYPAVAVLMMAGLLATQEGRSDLAPSAEAPLLYLSDMEFSGIPNPRKIDYAGDWLVSNHLWGRLVRFGEIGSESEDLSQSWTRSRDGLLWKFKLRDRARWSDGSELTADDVVASIKESLSGTVHTHLASYVSSVKSEGKSTIVFVLKALPENFLFSLACPDFAITDTKGVRFSGPYRVTDAKPNAISLEWNEFYSGPRSPSAPKRVVIEGVRNYDDSISRLLSGNVHVFTPLSDFLNPIQDRALKSSPEIMNHSSSPDWTIALWFSKRGRARFSSEERRWIFTELRKRIANIKDFGAAPATGIRPPTKLGGVSQEVFDQWLKEAVKKEPEPKKREIDFFLMEKIARSPVWPSVQNALKDMGFKVRAFELGPNTPADIWDRANTGDFEFSLRLEGVADPDPDSAWRYMMEYAPSEQKKPVSDDELNTAMMERDRPKRAEIYRGFEKRVLENPFLVPLRMASSRIAIRKPWLPPQEGQFEWGVQIWMFRRE